MKKVLQKYGILFFFCAIMGGIIMVDSIFALSFTDRERGLAANFSNSTKKISILQADSQDSFSQADLMYFLQDKRKSETINLLKAGQYGAELYSNVLSYFRDEVDADGKTGIWLRKDEYEDWSNRGEERYYYKEGYFTVLGTYGKKELEEKYIADMRGVLNNSPEEAVKGVYYLDCGQNTNSVFEDLQARILEKNQYAQIIVLEESSEGYMLQRLLSSTDAMYYLLQMGILTLLNLFNFGNIAGHWISARKTEIFVRKMVGGSDSSIFWKLVLTFAAATGVSILAGGFTGTMLAGINVKIVGKAICFGGINCVVQWGILLLFGGILVWRQVGKTLTELHKYA